MRKVGIDNTIAVSTPSTRSWFLMGNRGFLEKWLLPELGQVKIQEKATLEHFVEPVYKEKKIIIWQPYLIKKKKGMANTFTPLPSSYLG